MGLQKLRLAPDQSAYSNTDGAEVVSTQLDGGAGRYRRDIIGASSSINVQWSVGPEDFRYLKSFFLFLTGKGAAPFLIDLYMDREVLTEHRAYFRPGSFSLVSQQGEQFVVGAQLEAVPAKLTEDEEEAERIFAILYGDLGPGYENLFPPLEDEFDTLVNFSIPEAIG